jgi:hypothetical protein
MLCETMAARFFANRYRNEAAGVVIVDSPNDDPSDAKRGAGR